MCTTSFKSSHQPYLRSLLLGCGSTITAQQDLLKIPFIAQMIFFLAKNFTFLEEIFTPVIVSMVSYFTPYFLLNQTISQVPLFLNNRM